MPTEDCYRYRVYDITTDEYIYGTRYATMGQINRIRAEAVMPGARIDVKYLAEGWTKKGFDPTNPA